MTHSWILDVLADLRAYAHAHDLRAVSDQLDDALNVAVAELNAASRASETAGRQSREPKSTENGGEARSSM